MWLALAPEAGRDGGQFWHDRRPRSVARLPRTTTDPAVAAALWDEVEKLADHGSKDRTS